MLQVSVSLTSDKHSFIVRILSKLNRGPIYCKLHVFFQTANSYVAFKKYTQKIKIETYFPVWFTVTASCFASTDWNLCVRAVLGSVESITLKEV